MASGTITLDSTRDVLEGRISWSSSSLGSERNASSVYAELQVRRDGYPTYGTWNGFLNIGGDERYFSVYINGLGSDWVTLISFSITRGHEPDGTGECYIGGRGNGPSGTSMEGHYVSGGKTVTLDTIPRYITGASLRVLKYDLNTAKVKWYADQLCSKIKYGLSPNDMTETSVNTNSSTFNFTGLQQGTEYTIYFNAKRKDSGLYLPNNITLNFSTYPKGTLVDVPNVDIGSEQTLKWANPSEMTLSLKLCQIDGTLIEDFGNINNNRSSFIGQNFSINSVDFEASYQDLILNGTSSAAISSTNENFENNFPIKLESGTYRLSHKTAVCDVYLYKKIYNIISRTYDNVEVAHLEKNVLETSFTLNEYTKLFMGLEIDNNETFNNVETDIYIQKTTNTDSNQTTIIPTAANLYNLTPYSNIYEAKYVLTTTQGSNSYTDEKQCTFTVVDSSPIISTYNVRRKKL